MKDTDFEKLIEIATTGNVFVPANQNAIDLLQNSISGEVVYCEIKNQRDLTFHKAYFAFLGFVYSYLPQSFKKKIPKKDFYNFVKILKGDIDIIFEFKNGIKMYKYQSISFSNMNEKKFRTFIKLQIPFIYENLIGAFYKDSEKKSIIDTIEQDFEVFLSKLFAK